MSRASIFGLCARLHWSRDGVIRGVVPEVVDMRRLRQRIRVRRLSTSSGAAAATGIAGDLEVVEGFVRERARVWTLSSKRLASRPTPSTREHPQQDAMGREPPTHAVAL